MRVVVFALVLSLALSAYLKPSHNYWTTSVKQTINLSDAMWSYCDDKCVYLEKLYPGNDFVSIDFKSGSIVKPDFSACYVVVGTDKYSLWSKVAGANAFYNENCGSDNEDYYAVASSGSGSYKVLSINGKGINTEIDSQ